MLNLSKITVVNINIKTKHVSRIDHVKSNLESSKQENFSTYGILYLISGELVSIVWFIW